MQRHAGGIGQGDYRHHRVHAGGAHLLEQRAIKNFTDAATGESLREVNGSLRRETVGGALAPAGGVGVAGELVAITQRTATAAAANCTISIRRCISSAVTGSSSKETMVLDDVGVVDIHDSLRVGGFNRTDDQLFHAGKYRTLS